MHNTPKANAQFAALDDRHRRIDGPLSRTPPVTGSWQLALKRDGERRMAACRRAIARRREAVACLNPRIDPVLFRLTERLERLRAASIKGQPIDKRVRPTPITDAAH